MKIGFTGTREGMTNAQQEVVRQLVTSIGGIEEVHHGDCVGADEQFVKMFSKQFDKHVLARIVSHPPIIPTYRARCYSETVLVPKEYLDRNRDIVNASDVIIAAPKEMTEQARGGTWYTIRYAAKAGKPVWIVLPDGEVVRGVPAT